MGNQIMRYKGKIYVPPYTPIPNVGDLYKIKDVEGNERDTIIKEIVKVEWVDNTFNFPLYNHALAITLSCEPLSKKAWKEYRKHQFVVI
jgi:hypothetical protein